MRTLCLTVLSSLLVVSALLADPKPGDPDYSGVLCADSWNSATGTSISAFSDNGFWSWGGSNGRAWPGVSQGTGGRFEVLPGGPAGNNLLSFWITEKAWSGVWKQPCFYDKYEHTYFRFYTRVFPHTTFDFNDGHFVQNFQSYKQPNGVDWQLSTNAYFGVNGANQTTWSAYFATMANTAKYDNPIENRHLTKWSAGPLDCGKWYRVEGHIHWLNHAKGPRTMTDPTRYEVRIYDENDKLVVSGPADWHTIAGLKLSDWYDQGNVFLMDGTANSWAFQNNGPLSAKGSGLSHQFSAFELRNDKWPGPVTGKIPAPK